MQPDGTNEFESVGGQPRRRWGRVMGEGGGRAILPKQRDSHPSSQRNPSASCLAGFITAPFITACLDNAVVVPIVNGTETSSWPTSPSPRFAPSSNGPAENIDSNTFSIFSPPLGGQRFPDSGRSISSAQSPTSERHFRDSAESEGFVHGRRHRVYSNLFSRDRSVRLSC